MPGYFSLVLHAHLPYVRHPEHERFLEESWLFEAILETYLPLIQVMDGWLKDGLQTRLSISLTPTLCSLLLDPLLQHRFQAHLERLLELSDKEVHRTLWDPDYHALALLYHERFLSLKETYESYGRNVVGAFRKFQERGKLEIMTCAATHALLPLLADHHPSLRAQILVARDHYRECFGKDPRGIWLPECAYTPEIDSVLQEANLRWFVLETHGVLHANPRPRYGIFAPIFTPNGLAVFGRDLDSARQVWSKHEGYPGDKRYRDFYRDVGFDLDYDYIKPYLPDGNHRGFTGLKYHRIAIDSGEKEVYNRQEALHAAAEHAGHFLSSRVQQFRHLNQILDRPPILVSPYDAELFGHWWYEGPEFLDYLFRKIVFDQNEFMLVTPQEYLYQHPTQQVAVPSPSSWGEEGYWRVWLNESNEWIYPHLHAAQDRMIELAVHFTTPGAIEERALKQAARELLLAQASDWPFILRTGTSPEYAKKRVKSHLLRFNSLYEQLMEQEIKVEWLEQIEGMDNLFPDIDYRYWAGKISGS